MESEDFLANGSSFADALDANTVATPHDNHQVNAEVIFILRVLLTGALCLFGFVGNVVTFIALCKDPRKSSYVYLLCSLCIADWFMLLFLFIGVVLIEMTRYFSITWYINALTGSRVVLPVIWSIGCIIQTTAIWLVVAVTWDRFIAVCWPFMQTRTNPISRAKKLISGVFIFAVVFNIPRFFHYHSIIGDDAVNVDVNTSYNSFRNNATILLPLYNISLDGIINNSSSTISETMTKLHSRPTQNNINKTSYLTMETTSRYVHNANVYVTYNIESDLAPTKSSAVLRKSKLLRDNAWYHYIYYVSLSWLVMYIVPFILLLVLNVMLFRQIRQSKQYYAKLANTNMEKENVSVTINIVAIVTVFLICHTPDFVDTIISYQTLNIDRLVQKYMRSVAFAFLALNSSLNFIIYCLFYKRFRWTVLQMFCSWNPRVHYQQRSIEHLTVDNVPIRRKSDGEYGRNCRATDVDRDENGALMPNHYD